MKTAGFNSTDYIDSCRLVRQRLLATVAFVSKRTTLVNINGIFCCHVDYRRFRALCSVNFLSCVEKLYLLILVKTQCRKQNFGVRLSHNTETNVKDVELPCTCQLVNCVVLTYLIYFMSCVQRNWWKEEQDC